MSSKRIICFLPILAIIAIVYIGCERSIEKQSGLSMADISFRDIPGVTEDEIKAIEAFQRENRTFTYVAVPTTEAFLKENGEIGGFSALFCEWLTKVFGISFKLEHIRYDNLIPSVFSGKVDFSGDFRPTEERRQANFMSDPIALRWLISMRLKDSQPIENISLSRLPRYAFLGESVSIQDVADVLGPGTYETVIPDEVSSEYLHEMLIQDKMDAFIVVNTGESVYDQYDDIIVEDFFPFVFSPVSLITAKADLAPIVSVVDKALKNGAIQYLSQMYKQGYIEYRKNKLFMMLNEEEKAYMQNFPVVPIVASNWLYPINFYNKYEKRWEGISFDILDEVEKISGLNFEVVGSPNASWDELYEMMQNGKASVCLDFIRTPERVGRYQWSNYPYLSENYALISKHDFPNLSTAEIYYAKVGLIKSTGYADMFRQWFPGAVNITMYEMQDDAFRALDKGEIDLVMAGTNTLLSITNYYEFSNYKANFIFESTIDFSLAFNVNQYVLYSIVEKALSFIDIKTISQRWESKTFDYQSKLMRAQRPYLIGAIVLSLTVLALVFVLLVRSRNAGKRLEELVKLRTGELELRTEEAKMASNAKSAFLANMSHEMRTPMNVVVGLTDLMLEDDDPSEHINENLKTISTAGNTLLGLINDVLDFSKIEAGKLELTPVQYDIPSFLSDIITLNMIRIESKPIAFRLDIDEELPCSLYGDDLRVKQIINNLLSNAFKYTQRGTIALKMSCSTDKSTGNQAQCKGDEVWMSVCISDTGIGIREDDLKKLFTDYSQVDTKANRRIEGTGLGLSITKMLVEQMHGEISVESEFSKGTTFHVRIRQGFVSDDKIGTKMAESLVSFRYLDNRKRASQKLVRPDLSYACVLVVDDMQTNLDVATGMLKKYKMRVDCVASGQEAIDRIAAEEPVYDAIFMDHMMPVMDGIEATEKIRAIGTNYAMTIPVVALTANAIAGNEQMFLNKDFQAFLPKPINIMKLDSVVQRWVRDKTRE